MKRPGALRYSFLGLDFDGLDALAAAKKIVALAREGRFSYIATPNCACATAGTSQGWRAGRALIFRW